MLNIIKIGLLTTILFTMAFLPGCILNEEEDGESITVVDDMGNDVTIKKWPERIVSLSPSVTEILYDLKIGDRIVGVDSASNYPPEAKNNTVVFSYLGLDAESYVSVNPDLVILHHVLDLSENARSKIRELGHSIIVLNPAVIEDVLDNIDLIGKVTNRNSEAKVLIKSMEKRIDDVEEAGLTNATVNKPKVLYVVYYDSTDNPWVAGQDTYMDDVISKAGGLNIIKGAEGTITVDLETIVDEDPDLIITSQNAAFPTQSRKLILDDPALQTINAVKNGNVIDIDADLVERPGPRIVQGLEGVQNLILGLEEAR